MPTRRQILSRAITAVIALPIAALAARAGGLAPAVPPPAPTRPAPATPAMGQIHQVSIQGFAFVPAAIAVAPGDTVVFTNRDIAPHTVTSESGVFDSGRLGSGQSVRMSFSARGEYPYLCAIHPRMRGTLRVG